MASFMLALLLTVSNPQPPQRWVHDRSAALEQGRKLYQRGRASRMAAPLESAARLLRRATELAGDGATAAPVEEAAEAQFYLGASLGLLQRDAEAALAYRACIKLDPVAGSSSWHNLGAIHERAAAWPAAAEAYAQSVALLRRQRHHCSKKKLLEELGALGRSLIHAGRQERGGHAAFAEALWRAERDGASWPQRAGLHYLWGRSIELFGETEAGQPQTAVAMGALQRESAMAASNFSRAMQLATSEGVPPGTPVIRNWDAGYGAIRSWLSAPLVSVTYHAAAPTCHAAASQTAAAKVEAEEGWQRVYGDARGVVLVHLKAVWLCGNDAVVLAPGHGGAKGGVATSTPVLYVSSHSEQIPFHFNLPPFDAGSTDLRPAAAAGLHPERWLERGVLLSQTFGVGYYHWVADLVPRLLYARHHAAAESGAQQSFIPADTPFILQADHGGRLHGYVRQWLGLLGVPEALVVPYEVVPQSEALGGVASVASALRLAVGELYVVDWAVMAASNDGGAEDHTTTPAAAAAAAAADDARTVLTVSVGIVPSTSEPEPSSDPSSDSMSSLISAI